MSMVFALPGKVTIPIWANPLVLVVVWALVALGTLLQPEAIFHTVLGAPKYFELSHFWLYLVGLIAFTIGVLMAGKWAGSPSDQPRQSAESLVLILEDVAFRRAVLFLLVLTLLAYGIWFGPTLNSAAISVVLSGSGNLRETVSTIPGLTTMTQFGVAISVVAGYASVVTYSSSVKRFYLVAFTVVVGLALYRTLVWSERLALLEILISFFAAGSFAKPSATSKQAFQIAALIAGAVLVFAVFEYFRSWSNHQHIGASFIDFSVARFTAYYTSSLNNFAMVLDHHPASGLPVNALSFFYNFPLMPNSMHSLFADWWVSYEAMLVAYANPEFNLLSAIGFYIADVGPTFGISLCLAAGLLTGTLFQLLKRGELASLFFYPVWLVGLFEMGRLSYWGGVRAFPIWLSLFGLWVLGRQVQARLERSAISQAVEPSTSSLAGQR